MDQVKIYSKQRVAEALVYMRNGEVSSLPVYDEGHFIGKIAYEDLMAFLDRKDKSGDSYVDKLNFDIRTAMLMIKRINPNSHPRNRRGAGFSKQLLLGLSSVAVVSLLLMGISKVFFKQEFALLAKNDSAVASVPAQVVLTFPDGRNMPLSEGKTGLVIGNSGLRYSDGSAIDYRNSRQSLTDLALYRTGSVPAYSRQMVLNVPAGGMYRVILPDGSKVWLNAASSLKFPETFEGATKRCVELIGEAYFEIAKVDLKSEGQKLVKKAMPFVVVTKTQEIEVLGTHFNVHAYDDEEVVKTTLVEGSISLRPSMPLGRLPGTMDPSSIDPLQVGDSRRTYGKAILLKPNQEAVLTGFHTVVKDVDANEAFAWTDGEYIFRNTSLETVMNTIVRWYDIEVVYEHEKAGAILLGGAISRSSEIADVLKMLELTANIHFKIEGKRIIVVE